MQLNFHPAPGLLGDLLPGTYVVPQNPITGNREYLGRVPHVGELMPAQFSVPQNPLRDSLGLCGCGGTCGGTCGGCSSKGCSSGDCGVGSIGSINGVPVYEGLGGFLEDASAAVSNITQSPWLLYGGIALLGFWLLNPSHVRAERDAELLTAKARYARERARIKRSSTVRGRLATAGESRGWF